MSVPVTVGVRINEYGGVCPCGQVLLFPREDGRPVPVSQVRCPHCGRTVRFAREEDDLCPSRA